MRLSLPFLLSLGLAACGSDDPYASGKGLWAGDYLPPVEHWAQYGPAADPSSGPFLMIEVDAQSWELRQGESWTEAPQGETLPWDGADGLLLGGTRVLPAELEEGAEQDGVTVISIGDETVYYGTFGDTCRTSVPSGRFAGEWAFAPGMGPIALVLDGVRWELVYYL